MRVYICNSCGGEIVCDENTAASKCPLLRQSRRYDGSAVGRAQARLHHSFKLDKKAAKEGLLKHISGKRLLPKTSRTKTISTKSRAFMYLLFDAGADADIRYHATKVRT